MTPEVAARLKEITVDPKSVQLAPKIDVSKVGVPQAATDLKPGTAKYKITLNMNGQSVPLEMTSDIKEDGDSWAVTDTMQTPAGPASDTTVLEKQKFLPKERHVKQGPVAIDLTFADQRVTGSMSMNGQSKPVDIAAEGPMFADSAGSFSTIAALPLADGYETAYRTIDIQKQKVKVLHLKVAGSENVTVPAGSFDAYRVEITPADGGPGKITLWVAKQEHKTAKYEAVVPEMGGAHMIGELMP
jgi:hypothetical protein